MTEAISFLISNKVKKQQYVKKENFQPNMPMYGTVSQYSTSLLNKSEGLKRGKQNSEGSFESQLHQESK